MREEAGMWNHVWKKNKDKKKLPLVWGPVLNRLVFNLELHLRRRRERAQTHTHADTHTQTHHTRENYVSFWAHEQTRRECRQTDDYLHDKDLKYSSSKRFPLKLVHHFPRRRRRAGRAGFDIRAIFQKVSETPALDSTSARTAGGERRSRIAVSLRRAALMLSRSTSAGLGTGGR